MKSVVVVLSFSLLVCTQTVFAATINVPADQPTIQAAINSASDGDTVLVAPGKYTENIDFIGKAIIVTSSGGPAKTTIAGAGGGAVASFTSGEGNQSVISGFTIENGGGVNGGGIYVYFSSPVIRENRIYGNSAEFGGGIFVTGSTGPGAKILKNTITENLAMFGAGISLDGASSVTIENNTIIRNFSQVQGGAIWINGKAAAIIVQNLIVSNGAPSGEEVYSLTPQSTPGYHLINNTIVSVASSNSGVVVTDGFNSTSEITNNLIIAQGNGTALDCNPTYDNGPPIVQNNDVVGGFGTAYGGSCAGFSGRNGNISANPDFVKPATGSFQLQGGSPAIDAGDDSAPDLPKKDFAGNPRIVDGNGDGSKIIDMGAYEFQ